MASQKAAEKSSAKKVLNVPKDGLAEGQPDSKVSTSELGSSDKSPLAEDTLLPQKKFIRRLVGSSRDGHNTNKDTSKKNSGKAVSTVPSKDETSLVNGEANVG